MQPRQWDTAAEATHNIALPRSGVRGVTGLHGGLRRGFRDHLPMIGYHYAGMCNQH